MKQRIFSGIQPSGNLHIGNFLGAIKNWVALQKKYESIFCIVDLHAITVPQNPDELRKKTLELAKIYLAAGIDTQNSTIFVQSHVPEHTELAWILNTITRMSDLSRMTQFKDKSRRGIKKWKDLEGKEKNREVISAEEYWMHKTSAGLFNYPVLMAADILLYDTNIVPVGEDQIQHVELARDLGRRFNTTFGETFVIPEPHIVKEGMRIMGLDDPTKKMSKSAPSEMNYIALTDSPEKIREKIKKAVTDSGKNIKYSDDKPAIKNLINIYALLDNAKPKDIEESYKGKSYSEFKADLAEVIVDFLKDFQEKYNGIEDQDVLQIIEEGKEKAKKLAEEKMKEVKEKVGLLA
ncbi:MAG: tryptophan--tRNA ligase [Candidatus Moranbacteria bacterium]|nr:tryptophan--tRNA ligase [Candidatus Moranbacteria bacterium]